MLGNLPPGAVFIVVNAILFRGICGTVGGILLWRGKRAGYYLTLVSWIYLIVVSILKLIELYNSGILLNIDFLNENFSSYGKPLAWSVVKIVFGVPIVYWVLKALSSGAGTGKPLSLG